MLEEKGDLISRYIKEAQKKAVRDLSIEEGIRLDGRKTTDIRPIWCEVDYLPSTHGSSIFTRGETKLLATANPWNFQGSQYHRSTHRSRRRTLLSYIITSLLFQQEKHDPSRNFKT